MKILVVKLSSLGDVVHAMPAVQDMHQALPDARIDWVVETGFAPLVRRCAGVRRVVESDIRRWRKSLLSAATRREWRAFRAELEAETYDAIIDLQGLTKSALVAWLARLSPGGKRYALGNKTEGAGYENPTRWVADVAIRLEPHVHAVQRSRLLCAQALGYAPAPGLQYGLRMEAPRPNTSNSAPRWVPPVVAFVHGTSRADKLWPEDSWVALGQRLIAGGFHVALVHGSAQEQARSERLALRLGPDSAVWPRLALDRLAERLAGTAGVIGVDSGLSHIAVALDLPHVQLYNVDTAWRTGPTGPAYQRSVQMSPAPDVESVWQAWQACMASAAGTRSTATA